MLARRHLSTAKTEDKMRTLVCVLAALLAAYIRAPALASNMDFMSGLPTTSSTSGNAPGNIFRLARNRHLSAADIDAFIDPSVTGSDRILARRLMAAMPANLRGDFVALERNNHLVSNNPAILRYVRVTSGLLPNRSNVLARHSNPSASRWNQRIRPFGQRFSASPPRVAPNFYTNCGPAQSNSGAYVRDVSSCGMTDGWGFVFVPCYAYYPASSNDLGYLYMELVGSGGATSGSAVEGGFQYNSDSNIQGYVRTTYAVNGHIGYQTMNQSNPNYRYGCGQTLVVSHGIAQAANNWIYTMVGQLPSNIDPRTQYINMNSQFFYPDNYEWLWVPPGSDMGISGTDQAGYPTPCVNCSVSKVTSIAQNGGYSPDGSYFGAGIGGAILWLEVIFGEYSLSCNGQSGGTCQIESTPSPTVYYAGTEPYPNATTSQSMMGPTGWGPYESFDQIYVGGGQPQQGPSGVFREPLPPMPCTADANGNCYILQSSVSNGLCDTGQVGVHGQPIFVHSYKQRYAIYQRGSPVQQLELAYKTTTVPQSAPCTIRTYWSPGEPRVQYNDANLP